MRDAVEHSLQRTRRLPDKREPMHTARALAILLDEYVFSKSKQKEGKRMGETLDYLENNREELGDEAAGFPTHGHIEYLDNYKPIMWPVCIKCKQIYNTDPRRRKCDRWHKMIRMEAD